MPAFFESARVVMVTVRKWGGVSLGQTAPARQPTDIKRMEVRSEAGGKSEGERKPGREKRTRSKLEKPARSGCKHAKEEKEASVWCACGCEQHRQQVRHGSVTNDTRV